MHGINHQVQDVTSSCTHQFSMHDGPFQQLTGQWSGVLRARVQHARLVDIPDLVAELHLPVTSSLSDALPFPACVDGAHMQLISI